MWKWTKRLGIWMLVFLWMLAGLQILANQKEQKEKEVSEVFSTLAGGQLQNTVNYYGILKEDNDLTSILKQEDWLRTQAGELGITDGILLDRANDDEEEQLLLKKEGKNGTTTIRLFAKQGRGTAVFVKIAVNSDLETAMALRKKLQKQLNPDMKTERSFVSIETSYEGKLMLKERNRIADDILEKLNATVISENRKEELYTIYAYTPYLQESEWMNGKKLNVNLMMHYDESRDVTEITGSIPFSLQ